MELLDIVDINDKVIGATNKNEAHENGYCHRISAVYVFTHDKKLLVQLRKKDGLLDHSVGGHVKQGESYDAAAIRESKEELGITTKKLDKIGFFYIDEKTPRRKMKVVHYFGLYETNLTEKEAQKIVKADDEVEKLIPMDLSEIAKNMTEEPLKYTTGFMATLNFYIDKRDLNIPVVTLQ